MDLEPSAWALKRSLIGHTVAPTVLILQLAQRVFFCAPFQVRLWWVGYPSWVDGSHSEAGAGPEREGCILPQQPLAQSL
jgi:hypothetical protein